MKHAKQAAFYERLVATCTTIVAVPGTIELSPPYAVRYGGIGIVSKLNRHVYAGVEPVDPAAPAELGEVAYYVPENEGFRAWGADRRGRFEEALRDFLTAEGLGAGLRIHVLSELPFYRGLNMDSAVALAIASVVLLASGAVDVATMDGFTTGRFEVLIKDASYQRLFQLAWRLEALLLKYRPEGHHLYAAMTATDGCTVFWRDSAPSPLTDALLKEDPLFFHPCGCRFDSEIRAPSPAESDPRSSWPPPSANEDNPDSESPAAPTTAAPLGAFDLALVFFGRETDSEDVYAAHRKGYRRDVDSCVQKTVEATEAHARGLESKARFLTMGAPGGYSTATKAADRVMDLFIVKSMETFAALHRLGREGMTRSALRGLVLAADQAQDLYRIIDLSAGFIDEACHLLRHEMRDLTRQKVGVRLMGAGRGGCLLVIGARGSLAAALPVALAAVREKLRLPPSLPSLHWTSYDDGYPPRGRAMHVAQHTVEDRYFAFPTPRTLLVREWVGGVAGSPRLEDKAGWSRSRGDFDVVFEFHEEPHVWYKGAPLWLGSAEKRGGRGRTTVDERLKSSEATRPRSAKDAESRSSQPKPIAPKQTLRLLDALFSKARAGVRSVTLDVKDVVSATSTTYDNVTNVKSKLLNKALGEAICEACGFRFHLRDGKNWNGEYELIAEPNTTIRLALVWRWPPVARRLQSAAHDGL